MKNPLRYCRHCEDFVSTYEMGEDDVPRPAMINRVVDPPNARTASGATYVIETPLCGGCDHPLDGGTILHLSPEGRRCHEQSRALGRAA